MPLTSAAAAPEASSVQQGHNGPRGKVQGGKPSSQEVTEIREKCDSAATVIDRTGESSTPSWEGHSGADEDCCASCVLSSSHTDGSSDDPGVARSRSTSEDAAGDSSASVQSAWCGHTLQKAPICAANRATAAKSSSLNDDDDPDMAASDDEDYEGVEGFSIMESDDGDDGDLEEEDEEETEMEVVEPEPAQQVVHIVPDFDANKFETTTCSSKAHEACLSRMLKACFPGLGVISFERLYRTSQPVKDITRESILMRDHILLPDAVATKAQMVSKRMLEISYGWVSDDYQLVHVLWMEFFRPELCEAQQRAAEAKWQEAFAHMLGLQLFLDGSDDRWLTGFPLDAISRLRQWLQVFAYMWRTILSNNDSTLGLHPPFGKHGGYRRRLLQMIGQWEDRCNQVLLARFDPLVGDDEVIRVRILTETPADSSEDLASGFDSDCSYDSSA